MIVVKQLATVIMFSLVTLTPALAEEPKELDMGTDPTRVSRSVVARDEHLNLRGGFNSDTLRLKYAMPLGPEQNYGLSLEVPITAVDLLGTRHSSMGDLVLGVTKVFGLTRQGGYVAKAELVFDTADRPELGTGKNSFRATFAKALFLADGAIFAPALVHEESFSGQRGRTNVGRTTLDFYYVPKLADPRNFVTFDPSIVHDRELKRTYGALAVTLGHAVGKAFGGNQLVFVKPSVFAGADRPADWGLEVGYKLIGF